MRLRAITPIRVGPDDRSRRQARYDRLAPPGVTVELEDLVVAGAPTALDTDGDVRRSEELVATVAAATDPHRADAVLPDCVLDPAVPPQGVPWGAPAAATGSTAGEGRRAPVPVVGILRLAAGHLAALGRPIGAVARNEPIAAELARRLGAYGLGDRLVGVEVLDLPVDAIVDDHAWTTALLRSGRSLGDAGAAYVINGCSAVDVSPQDTGGPILVDPTALALRLLGAGPALRPEAA